MNLVDSSAWLEYLADGPNAGHFATAVEDCKKLLVPTICIYEVFKKVLRERGENSALQVLAVMNQGQIVELDLPLSLSAARLSIELGIPAADSIVWAAAKTHKAVLWTQDADFQGLAGVKFFPKKN